MSGATTEALPEDLITIIDAMDEGYGARSTFTLWVNQGKVSKYKKQGRVYFSRAELDAATSMRTEQPRSLGTWAKQAAADAPLPPANHSRESIDIVVSTLREALQRRAAREGQVAS